MWYVSPKDLTEIILMQRWSLEFYFSKKVIGDAHMVMVLCI